MEEKLETYRLRKRRLDKLRTLKETFLRIMSINNTSENDTKVNIEDTKSDDGDTSATQLKEDESSESSCLTYVTWIVYFLIWITLYAIAIELSFGTVYFMISLLVAVCFNTRVKPRGSREVSAYSVFNENCEAIDGTFKAEMFEKQLGLRQL